MARKQPVSVVVTVLNEAAAIDGLLCDLLAQDASADEIVVVDGGSTDGTQAVVESRLKAVQAASGPGPELRLISLPGANISRGRNRGIAEARNTYVAVTDAGVRLRANWLGLITAPLLQQQADVVAGFFQPDPHGPFETALGAATLPALADVDPDRFLPSSRSIAFSKDVWQCSGGYPEWLDYCEDLVFDINVRNAPAVRVVFEPGATVLFRPRSSLRAFFRQYYRYARGDGKAGLWSKRHAIRYLTYLHLLATIACLALPGASRRRLANRYFTASSLLGAFIYLWKPLRRLRQLGSGASAGTWLYMLALLPLIRFAGDLAKMAGYPAGCCWRLRHRPPDWRR